MSRPPIKTANNYNLDEVVSALQKAIRRGDERQALYWAVEMDKSGFAAYLWRRIFIICSEDIGLAEPNLPAQIMALYQMWEHLTKHSKKNGGQGEPINLFHAVMLLARAKKSRVVCDACVLHYESPEIVERLEIPDYALDQHTGRGRRMKRRLQHFLEEGARLENEDKSIKNPYVEPWTSYWLNKEQKKPQENTLFDLEVYSNGD